MAYHITNEISVPHRHIGNEEIADNGDRGDAAQTLRIGWADADGKPVPIVWMETNGNPVLMLVGEDVYHADDWSDYVWRHADDETWYVAPWMEPALASLGLRSYYLEIGRRRYADWQRAEDERLEAAREDNEMLEEYMEAITTRCCDCGEPITDAGDGEDGRCGNCADRLDQAEVSAEDDAKLEGNEP